MASGETVTNAQQFIEIKGAKMHNLKNVDVKIPHDSLVVVTGVSGSGKSSLAFDTLYAEGQRRYVESLSSYARQFLGKLEKPEVDYIKGLSPAIAIEQKVTSTNPRSTVGTTTEIYDYLKVLFARIGKTYSPISGFEVKKHELKDVVNYIMSLEEGAKLYLSCPFPDTNRSLDKDLDILEQQGFSRVKEDAEVYRIDETPKTLKRKNLELVIDRIAVRHNDEDFINRVNDSIQTAFYEGHGTCSIETVGTGKKKTFSNLFEADGIVFEDPSLHLFSFNNPFGACKKCEGFGSVIGIDEDLVIPNQSLSIYEDAIVSWKGEKMREWKEKLIAVSDKFDFPIHRPYFELTKAQQEELWFGNKHFKGIHAFFKWVESQSYKIQYRVMLSRYRGKTTCPTCKGKRLRKEANFVKVDGHTIAELVDLPLEKLNELFDSIKLNDYDTTIAKRLLIEIQSRLQYLLEVGLGYLTLNRISSTLSGGESQRINLATSLGSSLVGSTYILDEPSIGLHSRDTERLIAVIESLKALGNTVVVVEHDEAFMRNADKIIDIGPGAGFHGGNVVAEGTIKEISALKESLTGAYLTGVKTIPIPEKTRTWSKSVKLFGARENNLKNIDITIPLSVFTVVTGVSGSGKSTLIRNILYPVILKQLGGYGEKAGKYGKISGDLDKIEHIEFVDQNPIGKSSRSNPVTYLKAYDDIRNLYASLKLSVVRGFKAKHFSFNTDGGRCDMCKGEGSVTVEMQFMPDVHLKCETCNGQRYKDEVLEVKYEGKNIFDILEMTVNQAIDFFTEHKQTKISRKLKPLQDVGLGYVHLGQPSSTLSGGEAQRVKLASFLVKGSNEKPTFFIFDEPTTGLHFDDINKLLNSFNALLNNGHSVLVIEHNTDVIKCADWILDLGPEGGENGGTLVFEGTVKNLLNCKESYTAEALQDKFN
jgi:excinuclease ABC subunit A